MSREDDELRRQFNRNMTNHRPTENQVTDIETIRAKAKELGELIVDFCPHSRERSMAITELEYAVMRAVQSIVVHGGGAPTVDMLIGVQYDLPIDKLAHGIWDLAFDGQCHAVSAVGQRCPASATNIFCASHAPYAEAARQESM